MIEAVISESVKNCPIFLGEIIEGFALFEEIRDDKGGLVDLRFLQIKPSFETPSDLGTQAFLGKTVREVFPDLIENWFAGYDKKVQNESSTQFELYSPQTDHSYNVYAYVPTQGQIAAFIHDVTEQKRVERELQKSEEKFRTIFESSSVAITLIGLDGAVQDCNQSALNMLGFNSKEEFIGKDCFSFIAETDLPKAKEAWHRGLNGGSIKDQEFILTGKDQRQIYGLLSAKLFRNSQGKPYGMVITINDITGQKKGEEALLEAERRNRELLNAIPQLVWTSDSLGCCDFLGRQWVDYTGITSSEQMDYGWLERIHPDDHEDIIKAWEEAIASGGLFDVCCRIQGADGSYRWFQNRALALRNAAGAIIKWFGTSTDIDDQVRAKEALREADRRKDDFLAVLSHELRNPLAAIQNSIHILDYDTPAGDQAKRAKEVIRRQTTQLSRLVDDLLDITRITQNKIKLQLKRLEVNELVRRTIEDHRLLFERKGIGLEAEYSRKSFYVEADEARLGQVVGNLLQNAAKFTDPGGTTRVTITGESGERVAILIADSGIGMAPEMLSRLFQPFMQANMAPDRLHDGLGLGLALSKGLIEMQGGAIYGQSAGLGKGSEFVIYLPLQGEGMQFETTFSKEPQALSTEIPQHHRRILIIDDNKDLLDSLAELLELEGHEVAVAYNGPEGINKAQEFQPEILLCDIGLPGMDGYEIASAFRKNRLLKDVFLVALTGYVQPKDAQQAKAAGFDQHLAKPVDLEALEQILAGAPIRNID